MDRKRFVVTGQVQGVGFRPFVYRLALELRLTGWVTNDGNGVTVEVQGEDGEVIAFRRRLNDDRPPLAQIEHIAEADQAPKADERYFEIRPSTSGELADVQVTVDTAVCPDCLREMRTQSDPRFGYPFINCTNCGPRYSIVRRIPYDRPNTTMAEFAMCPLCGGEYGNPASRRFHAQPIACPRCGPTVWLVDTHGKQITCPDAIAETAQRLLDEQIVAIKGIGGFHLACRADRNHVVRRLRQRKRRDAKPFAIMVANLDEARRVAHLTIEAEELLTGPVAPIVLLPRREGGGLAASLTQQLGTIGLMLPYAPLHHLLFDNPQLAKVPLVMTSGNYSDEPLVKDNESAIAYLGRIADAILLHNRPIERRIDDSVVQLGADGKCSVLRRARGFAPQPVRVKVLQEADSTSATADAASAGAPALMLPAPPPMESTHMRAFTGQAPLPPMRHLRPTHTAGRDGGDLPAVLAVGAELKSAVCLYKDGRALVSEHIGDLKDGRTYRHFIDTISHLESLYEFRPEVLAADLHPQYLSTEYAMRRHRGELAGRPALPIIRVQHHHAHIVSCMAENGFAGPVIGLACDGTGYGDDGAVWGCEVLRADLLGYERLGHLRYLNMLGGDAAAHETYRPALAALYDTFGMDCVRQPVAKRLAPFRERLESAMELLSMGVNCPQTSSLGRWFDAVASLCSVGSVNRFEGQAPMQLESVIEPSVNVAYEFHLAAGGPFQIDLRPMVHGIVSDIAERIPSGVISAKFHNTVVAFLAASAERAREETGIETVALSGGCFANRYLSAKLVEMLERRKLRVLRHRTIPCNDGGVALGQAITAAARRRQTRRAGAAARHANEE